MARQLRPRVLAVGFGIYFAIIAIGSWQFAQSLPGPWYGADITRWVYTTYMLVAAIFLVGLAGLGLSIRASFSRQLREVDGRLGSAVRQSSREALPPPLAETQPNTRDTVDRDIDELLESLSEVEATANREAQAMDSNSGAPPGSYRGAEGGTKIGFQRQPLNASPKIRGRYLIGPGPVPRLILG